MYVRNLNGEEFPLQATHTHDLELNGNQQLSFTVLPTKVNNKFIEDITEMWETVDDDDVEYKIIYAKKRGEGNRLTVQVKAIPLFFDDFDTLRIYEEYNQSMTANAFFTMVFADTDYNVVLNGTFHAVTWEGLGRGETRLEMFKKGLNRYKAEFELSGNTVAIKNQIGRDTQFMYRYRLNASNIVQEIDASSMWTYAKGYGDFASGEEDNAALVREYTSPLASIIGIRHAPPIYDGRITDTETMDDSLKSLVDESLQISVTTDVHDLRKQGYPLAQPQLGDRVFLIDERIGLKDEIRVQDISITRDWQGNVLDLKLTIGSQSIRKRHQSDLQTAVDRINQIVEGRTKLPFSVLDAAVAQATKDLQSAQTELIFDEGIIAVDPNDPNKLVLFNSAGMGVSDDGGGTFKTAMTGSGIVADVITSGAFRTNNATIIGDSNYFYWDGSGLYAINPNDSDKYVRLRSDGLYISQGAMTIERPDGYKIVNDGKLNTDFSVQFSPTPHYSSGVEHENFYVKTSDTSPRIIASGRFRRDARYLKIIVGLWVDSSGETAKIRVRSQGSSPTIYATVTETSTDSNFEEIQRTITVDLGTPNGNRTSFYVELYSNNGTQVKGYVHSAWLEG